MNLKTSRFRALLLILGSAAFTLLPSHAQLTWDANGTGSGQTNGGGAWLGNNLWWNGSSNQNWVAGSNAIFGGPNTAGGAVTLASPTTVGSITLNTFTGTYTLGSGGQAITLNGGLANNSPAGAVTLSSPVTLGASQTWTHNSSGNLTVAGLVSTNDKTLTIAGNGPTTASGGITGTGAVVKNGMGRLVLRPGTHDFSGGLTLNGGVTMVDGLGNDKLGSGNLTLNGGVLEFYWAYTMTRSLGSAAGQVQLPGGNSGFAMNGASTSTIRFNNSNTFEVIWGGDHFKPDALVLNCATSQAGANLTFDNPLDLKGANRIIRSDATAQNITATMARTIRNTGGSPAGLIKDGPGLIVLSIANTYNGGTTINDGTLRFASLTSMPATGNVAVNNGGTLGINLGGTGQWTTGTTGNGTLGGLLNGVGGQSGSTISYSGNVGLLLETTGTLEFPSAISNVGDSLSLLKSGAGTLTLSGNNTYTGKTSVRGGTLVINSLRNAGDGNSSLGAPIDAASGAIAMGFHTTASTLRYTGGGDTSNRIIELAGSTAGVTVEASGTGALVLTSDLVPTFPTTANNQANKTFTLGGTSTAANTLSGLIPNTTFGTATSTLSLTKSGPGRWILSKASNTYTGATNISGGVLEVSKLSNGGAASSIGASAGSDGNLLLGDGATLRYTGAGDITDRRFRINGSANGHGATLDSSGSGALNFSIIDSPTYGTANQTRTLTLRGTNTGDNLLAANIEDNGSGAVSLIKQDVGIWVLTGSSTYSGTTTVNQGTLVVNGSLDASNVIVTGGTLSGTATLEGTVTVQAAGRLSPGYPSGTLHAGNVNLAGTFAVELADGDSDPEPALEVDGLLDLTGSTLDLNITAGNIQPFYVIATYGSLAGTFATVHGLPSGWTVNYQYGDNNTVAIVPPPPVAEPGQPTGLLAVSGISADGSSSLIKLDWNAANGAWSYIINRALVSGGPYTPVATTAQRTYNDLSVLPGQTYFYVIVAENPLGTGPASAEASATAVAPPPPAQPLGLTASTDNGIIRLSWNPSAAASGYIVKRSTTAGGPYTPVGTVSTPGYLETSGVAGTTYHYVVAAVNSGGESPQSEPVTALFSGDPILAAVDQLKGHITGATPLSPDQLAQASLNLKAQTPRFGESASTIAAVFDLVSTFDSEKGALFVTTATGGLTRSAETNDLNWTIYRTMQSIMDIVYTPQNLAAHEALLSSFKFGSHTNFPGPCAPPADPNVTRTVPINGSFVRTFGRNTQQWTLPARKPTGTYLAPGTVATVTVPTALVNAGYQIRVGAHSWDLSNRPSIRRLDRATLRFPITASTVKIASPYGGGIYIEVPIGASTGVVNVSVTGAVRAPYFSAKSFHQTTTAEWNVEKTHPAPWADFQSDKFMTQVPRKWIYNHPAPAQMMADWDAAMDAINSLMGFPLIRGKETMYPQVDIIMRSSVHAPGYPAVNVTANPNSEVSPAGYSGNYIVRGPNVSLTAANIEFHEQGHAYFFPKFGGESESNVNLLQPAMLNRKFGRTFDEAHNGSFGGGSSFITIDNTAVAWMCVFNFSPRKVPMADAEKAYQHKGHAKWMDIARLFGWQGMDDYWRSFMEDEANGIPVATGTDAYLLRLSRHVGKDIRPLFHFWGIHPQNPSTLAASIAAENIPAAVEIRNLLLHYKTLVPANNAAFRTFAQAWRGRIPTINGAWEEREHARQWDTTALYGVGDQQRSEATNPGEIYNENSANDIRNRVDELVALYFPSGITPATMGFSSAPGAINADTIGMTAIAATAPVGPIAYRFENTTTGAARDWSESRTWHQTGLLPGQTYSFRVKARNGLGEETAWSPALGATIAPTDTPFELWAKTFTDLTDASPALDFDGGGLTTALEWVLGGDPANSSDDASQKPTLDTTSDPDGKLLFIFRRSAAAHAASDTTIAVEYGSVLGDWTTATHQGTGSGQITFTEQADGFAPGIDKVTVALPASLAATGKFFARLKVRVSTP
jgi:autotransporter-associated beta strand protein